jgi:hypothetical protein
LAVLGPSVLSTAWPWKTTVEVAQTTTTTAPGPVIDVQGTGAVVLVVALGLVLALMWSVPFWIDARRNYRLRLGAITEVRGSW